MSHISDTMVRGAVFARRRLPEDHVAHHAVHRVLLSVRVSRPRERRASRSCRCSPTSRFSDAVYGLGAGIFFIGYFIFEVPSNLILHRVGARLWIARIMITWAIVSALTLFVKTPLQFYVLRFLLGVAEAGFLPGIMLYLTYWFPRRSAASRSASTTSRFRCPAWSAARCRAGSCSNFTHSTVMAGWQWLFLIEAVPALVAGIAVLALMVDKPHRGEVADRRRESAASHRTIEREDAREDARITTSRRLPHRSATSGSSCAVYFCQIIGLYGISLLAAVDHQGQRSDERLDYRLALGDSVPGRHSRDHPDRA